MTATAGYLFEGADWNFSKLQRIHDACEEIARRWICGAKVAGMAFAG